MSDRVIVSSKLVRERYDVSDPPKSPHVVARCRNCNEIIGVWDEGLYFPPTIYAPCRHCGHDAKVALSREKE